MKTDHAERADRRRFRMSQGTMELSRRREKLNEIYLS